MSETQVLMTFSNLRGFFSRNHFLDGALFFNGGGGGEGGSFLSGGEGGISFDGEGFEKNQEMRGGGAAPLWETLL